MCVCLCLLSCMYPKIQVPGTNKNINLIRVDFKKYREAFDSV